MLRYFYCFCIYYSLPLHIIVNQNHFTMKSKSFLNVLIILGIILIFSRCEKDSGLQDLNLKKQDQKQSDTVIRTVPSKITGRPIEESGSHSFAGDGLKSSERGTNKLGMWLWYLEGTGYDSHSELASDLYAIGVKRIYIKVADGTNIWKECQDGKVVSAYKNAGLEVWGWSYNYPDNEYKQANALYYASKAGYDGYVLDIEKEFNGTTTALHDIFEEFHAAKDEAAAEGYINSNFQIYSTSWGNPGDHGMRVDIIDEYVDAHLPQTYVEVWGDSYMNSPGYWVDLGTREYRDLGCEKPVHHIVSAEYDEITAGQINEFIEHSGEETSIWRIPGGGTSLDIWKDIENVNWGYSQYEENLTIECPSEIQVNKEEKITGEASSGIKKIVAHMDQYKIAEENVSSDNYNFSANFNTEGEDRILKVEGYDNNENKVAESSVKVDVVKNATSQITIETPETIVVDEPAMFKGKVSSDVSRVEVFVDEWQITEEQVNSGSFSFSHSFSQTGEDRIMVIKGYDNNDEMIIKSQEVIDIYSADMELDIILPEEIVQGEKLTFEGSAPSDATQVVVSVDDWEIANEPVEEGEYSFDYVFSSSGQNRELVVNALNSSGESIVHISKYIDISDESTPYIDEFPYFYQYNNSISPGGSCQNTAMAMVIKYYGGNSETPDQISDYYGTKPQQDVEGWESTFNNEARYFDLNIRGDGSETYTVQDMRNELNQGKPVVVHGYFTEDGHVVVVLGFDGTYYYVHDPAGEWSQQYGYGGYSGNNGTEGKYIKYHKDNFEAAVSPDGYIWMHRFYSVN